MTHSSVGAGVVADVIPKLNSNAPDLIRELPQIDGYVILNTCNRFEIYTSASDDDAIRGAMENFARKNIPYSEKDGLWYILSDISSVRHLFRVSCGLDSLVIGEDQIQGQVKDSFLKAKEEGHVSGILGRVFEKALYVGKKVRSETKLNNGAVSVGSAAVKLAEEKIGDLSGKNIVILGAGDMATVIAKSLIGHDPNAVFVSSRTYEHAMVLAKQLGGTAVGLDHLPEVLNRCDLLIVATSAPHIILDKEVIERSVFDKARKLMIIDISVPRNVSDDVSELDYVELNTMNDISSLTSENLMRRRTEIIGAENIIIEEIEKIDRDRREIYANHVISGIARKTDDIRQEEMTIALSRAKNNTDIETIMDDFSRALISKIMAEPYDKLKKASRNGHIEVCEVATDLFGVDEK